MTNTNKYFYIAVSTQDENGKNNAYIVKASNLDNLTSKLNIKGLRSANICPSKKYAEELVAFWNSCYLKNGTYLFGDLHTYPAYIEK